MRSFIILMHLMIVSNCQSFINLNLEYKQNSINIHADLKGVKDPDSCVIYRSYENLNNLGEINLNEYPISKNIVKVEESKFVFKDTLFAYNCKYFYYLKIKTKDGKVIPSLIDSITIENRELIDYSNKKLIIFIDKKNYFLEIQADGIGIKRYPVNFGIKPWNRKLHFDKMSTPEGRYHLTHFNYKSSFHKSLGVSYPNSVDRKRYNEALRKRLIPKINSKYAQIGGSITIHGGGIGNNWTWGCIAMRNIDVDEILSLSNLKVGTPILIVGNEVQRKDLY